MKLRLVPVLKSKKEKAITIRQSRYVIGRAVDCDLRLNSPGVSRHHCELCVEYDQVRVRDLGSSNGTFVNGEPVSDDYVLKDGDILGVWANMYKVEIYASGSGIDLLLRIGRAATHVIS